MCWKLLPKINKYLSQIQTLLTSLTRYVKKEIHTKMIITLQKTSILLLKQAICRGEASSSSDCSGGPQQIASVQADGDDLRKKLCSLNLTQHKTLNIGCHWAKNKLKQMNSVFETVVEALNLFFTSGAGVGKSHLVEVLTSFLTKILIYTQ